MLDEEDRLVIEWCLKQIENTLGFQRFAVIVRQHLLAGESQPSAVDRLREQVLSHDFVWDGLQAEGERLRAEVRDRIEGDATSPPQWALELAEQWRAQADYPDREDKRTLESCADELLTVARGQP
jgi:hypothetical protein